MTNTRSEYAQTALLLKGGYKLDVSQSLRLQRSIVDFLNSEESKQFNDPIDLYNAWKKYSGWNCRNPVLINSIIIFLDYWKHHEPNYLQESDWIVNKGV